MIIFALLGFALFVGLIFGPQFWITWTMRTHAVERPDIPGTGGELARHLLDDAGLQHVKLEIVPAGDHYSPDEKVVRLSEANFKGRSITAIAVAAHEVAHAVQHRDCYGPLLWRQRLVKKTIVVDNVARILLLLMPIGYMFTRNPILVGLDFMLVLGLFASTILIHLVTLPTELDASFNKALPVLERYVPPDEMRGARAVLKAAAFTYVAGALVSLLNVARWLRVLRF
jgi:uncharacterized protein